MEIGADNNAGLAADPKPDLMKVRVSFGRMEMLLLYRYLLALERLLKIADVKISFLFSLAGDGKEEPVKMEMAK
ncbi:hypothetical protein Syun_023977 [Stephania yunnanensis]|uniref:Uncharacterized protein n=1 Tax=Stephania yunnanensis TaxID=152371 RepID=A0AAP0FAT7_9MAGN